MRSITLVGDKLISGSVDGTVRYWDTSSGNCVHIACIEQGGARCAITKVAATQTHLFIGSSEGNAHMLVL